MTHPKIGGHNNTTVCPMTLYVHNTRSGEKEKFIPLRANRVGMYVCGVTVYDDFHVGHARSYVAFDIIRRYLTYMGYEVTYVQNFTDVDDKIIARAAERGVDPLDLSRAYIRQYFEDADRLNILRADFYPKATEYIPEMIELIRGLMDRGHAYTAEDGSVYFEIETARERFGQLRHQSLDDMLDGARVEVDERKRNPKDFALWKAARPGEISWDSPWGKGRPGWHIECSAMSTRLIGTTLDIHGGWMDLLFPHHESEILQSECFTGEPFARYWLHNGLLNLNQEKMSKSMDNFFSVKQVLRDFHPMVLRFFLAYTHYRSPIEFSEEALLEARKGYERLKGFRERLSGMLGRGGSPGGSDTGSGVRVQTASSPGAEIRVEGVRDGKHRDGMEQKREGRQDGMDLDGRDSYEKNPYGKDPNGKNPDGIDPDGRDPDWIGDRQEDGAHNGRLNEGSPGGSDQPIPPIRKPGSPGYDFALVELAAHTTEEFTRAMDDDFNTRMAMATLFSMVGTGNRILNELENNGAIESHAPILGHLLETFDTLTGDILGLAFGSAEPSPESSESLTSRLIEFLMEIRALAREQKNWVMADMIRERFGELGIILEDRGGTTIWKME